MPRIPWLRMILKREVSDVFRISKIIMASGGTGSAGAAASSFGSLEEPSFRVIERGAGVSSSNAIVRSPDNRPERLPSFRALGAGFDVGSSSRSVPHSKCKNSER